MKVQEKIDHESLKTVRWYGSGPVEPMPIPILGPDSINPRDLRKIEVRAHAEPAVEPGG